MFDCSLEIENYQCKTCPGFQTNLLTSLSAHIRGGHRGEGSEQVPGYSNRIDSYDSKLKYDLFRCAQCPSGFTSKTSLDYHVISRHTKPEDVQWLKCDKCFTEFKSKANLNYHIRAYHSGHKNENLQYFRCCQCPAVFVSNAYLNVHIKASHPKPGTSRELQCQQYSTSSEAASEGIKWFECAQCPYKCNNRRSVEQHVKYHYKTTGSPFGCEHCTCKFKAKATLNAHVKAYHDSAKEMRSFDCSRCSYKVKDEADLKNHVKYRHCNTESSDEKRSVIPDTTVLKHYIVLQHQRDIQFKCGQCSCKFESVGALEDHSKTHVRFECPHCPYKFRDGDNLKKHVKYRH